MRRFAGFVGFLVLAGCASGAEPSRSEPLASGPSAASLQALHALEADSNAPWTLTFDPARGAPTHLAGRSAPFLRAGESHEEASLRFLTQYRDLFAIQDPSRELRVVRSRVDDLAMHHVRMQQQVGGVRVVGGEVMTHFGPDGAVTAVTSNYVPGVAGVDLNPAIEAEHAVTIAEDALRATDSHFDPGQFWKTPERELVVFVHEGQPRLAYRVALFVMSIHPANQIAYVDAHTGAVLVAYNDLKTAATTGTGTDSDGVSHPLQIDQQGSTFSLVDSTRTKGKISTFTFKNTPDTKCVNDQADDGCLDRFFRDHPTGELVTSTDKGSWDTANPGKGAAVEAHIFAGLVYDYYKNQHGRDSIDGKGMPMNSNVHFSTSFANAFWNGEGMFYGDGDTITLKLTTKGLDVIAHELTHGVTQFESSLEYKDQSGALNEAMSDIFGAFAEHQFFPDPKANWQIGEKVSGFLLNGPLRDMAHPASVLQKQPDNMKNYDTSDAAKQDNGGVHLNSGIVNNAAYLMTIGGTNDTSKIAVTNPIGWEKAQKLWYRTNTEYLMAQSNFLQAAQATISAAGDLGFTEREKATVECAWIATGVVTTPAACRNVAPDPDAGAPDAGGAVDGGGGGDVDAGGGGSGVDAGGGTVDAGSKPTADAGAKKDAGGGVNPANPGNEATPTSDPSGCGCRVPGPSRQSTGAAAALTFALATLFGARRRRSR